MARKIIWEDPPETVYTGTQGKRDKYLDLLGPLKEHPGKWARVDTGPPHKIHSKANNLRHGRARIPSGRWEFTSRTIDYELAGLYARYIGK